MRRAAWHETSAERGGILMKKMTVAKARPMARACILPLFAVLLSGSSASVQTSSSQTSPADVLLLDANVITMDEKQPSAQAIAIQGNRIAWVGSDEEGKRRYPMVPRTIDLHGATILPGIIDAHTHLMDLGRSLVQLNLKDLATEKEIVERVR